MPNGDLKNYLKKTKVSDVIVYTNKLICFARNDGNIPSPSQLLRFGKDIALGMRHLAQERFLYTETWLQETFY